METRTYLENDTHEVPMIGNIGVITSLEMFEIEFILEQEAFINPECVVLDNY